MAAPVQSNNEVTPVLQCHYGPIPVFQIGKATLWGGSYREIWNEPRQWKLLICCAGHNYAPAEGPIMTSTNAPKAIRDMTDPTPFISFDWPDGGLPPVSAGFWYKLTETLKTEVVGDVGVYCFGGHGRTGTALAILAALSGAVPKGEDPVQWLRDRYCKEVVETRSQCSYIEMVTEHEVNARPSFSLRMQAGAWHPFFDDFNLTFNGEQADASSDGGKKSGDENVATNAAGDVTWRNVTNDPDDNDYDDWEEFGWVNADVRDDDEDPDALVDPEDLRQGLIDFFRKQ